MAKGKFYIQQQFKMVYSNESIETPVGRAAWPSLVQPKPGKVFEEGKPPSDPKFEITILIPKEGKKTEWFVNELQMLVDEMKVEYNHMVSAKMGEVGFLQDGDAFDPEQYPHHQGCWVLIARNKKVVRTVDGSREPKDIPADKIEGGMKVKLLVQPYLHAKGVSFTLNIVQLVKDDGVRFSNAVRDFTKLLSACGEDDEEDTGSIAEETQEPEMAPDDEEPVQEATPKRPNPARMAKAQQLAAQQRANINATKTPQAKGVGAKMAAGINRL